MTQLFGNHRRILRGSSYLQVVEAQALKSNREIVQLRRTPNLQRDRKRLYAREAIKKTMEGANLPSYFVWKKPIPKQESERFGSGVGSFSGHPNSNGAEDENSTCRG